MSQVVLLIPTSSQYERKFDTVSRTWLMILAGRFMSFSLAIVPCQVSYRIAPQDDFDCISVHFLPPFLFWDFHIFSGSITLAMGIRFVKEISNPTASNKSRKWESDKPCPLPFSNWLMVKIDMPVFSCSRCCEILRDFLYFANDAPSDAIDS